MGKGNIQVTGRSYRYSRHLQDWDFVPQQTPHVSKKAFPKRPVCFPQDLQLIEWGRRTSPAEREVAPHLPPAHHHRASLRGRLHLSWRSSTRCARWVWAWALTQCLAQPEIQTKVWGLRFGVWVFKASRLNNWKTVKERFCSQLCSHNNNNNNNNNNNKIIIK